MLKKLIKYEFKATARYLLPLYAMLIAVAAITRIIRPSKDSLNHFYAFANTGALTMSAIYGIFLAVLYILAFFLMLQRFNKNLLGDEGYLMLTLPVKRHKLILSKLVVAVCWMLATMAVTAISAVIFAFEPSMFRDISFRGFDLISSIMLFLTVTAVSTYFALMFYTAIAIGTQAGKHRLIGSFLAFFFLVTLQQSLIVLFGDGFEKFADLLTYSLRGNASANVILLLVIVVVSALSALLFYTVNYILNKRLNLE